jgi:CHAT domain-containing protein
VIYAFLVITPQTKTQPDLILASNGKDMESKFVNYYRNNIKFRLEDSRSYNNYFESLATYLKDRQIKKVYLSVDGVYNQISLNTIKNPATQKYIIDEFDIRLITNTREVIEKKNLKSNSQSSVLIGFPKFNLLSAGEEAATTRSVTRGGNLSRGLRGGLLRYMRGEDGISVLPGTQEEIRQISKLSPNPEIFMEDMASEGLIKEVISPMILHIATHGYFLEDDEPALNQEEGKSNYVPSPLLKSGIILAGAENFLKSGIPVNDEGDDGILTAYEAMNLNLDDTELVVLSACETGLGVVKNGEGVYGLQRAFKMAGARSMIMSLWSVDDAATQELMSLFYAERSKYADHHEAFRIAQQKLKEKYTHPFYWGAFIMVGL